MKLDGISGIQHETTVQLGVLLEEIIRFAVRDNPNASSREITDRVYRGITAFIEHDGTYTVIEAYVKGQQAQPPQSSGGEWKGMRKMVKIYLVDDSAVNKQHVAEFGYDLYGTYRVVECAGQKGHEYFKIIVGYQGRGAKDAAEKMRHEMQAEENREWMIVNPPKNIGEFLKRITNA